MDVLSDEDNTSILQLYLERIKTMKTDIKNLNELLIRRRNSIFIVLEEQKADNVDFDKTVDLSTSDIERIKILICENYLKNGLVPSIRIINSYLTIVSVLAECYDAEDTITRIVVRDINLVKEVLGMNRTYVQLYKNLATAESVMGTYYDLVVQIWHYMSNGTWMPEKDIHDNLVLDYDNLVLIDGMTNTDVVRLLTSLIGSKTSIRAQDYDDIYTMIDYLLGVGDCKSEDILTIISKNCVFKEILANVVATLLNEGTLIADPNLFIKRNMFNTYKDILRLAVALQGGNPALCEHPLVKSKKMSSSLRKLIMRLMNNVSIGTIDQTRHDREAWIVIGDIIHPYSFIPKDLKLVPKNRLDIHYNALYAEVPEYTYAIMAWICIREKIKYSGNDMSFEQLMEFGNVIGAMNLVHDMPGLFCRKIDHLLREAKSHDERFVIADTFIKSISNGDVPISTLLTLFKHFSTRNDDSDLRIFSIKSDVVKLFGREEYRKPIEEDICSVLTENLATILTEKISHKEKMGKVYFNTNAFRGFVIPKSLRNQSSGRVIPRGSRFRIPNDISYFAPYIWWTNTKNEERVDLDLSAIYYTENFTECEFQNYQHKVLRKMGINPVHSGDITDGGDYNGSGVSEAIKIDLNELEKSKVKYIAITAHSFLNDPFCEQDHSYAGYALYTEDEISKYTVSSSEFISREKIAREVNLTANSTNAVIMVYDVANREVIWADQPGKLIPRPFTNIYNTSDSTFLRMLSLIQDIEVSLTSLIMMNLSTREAEMVDSKEEADIIFDEFCGDEDLDKKTIAPWNLEYYASNML